MSTILFTNELGGGLGHLNRLIAVAKRLASEHRLVFAVRNPSQDEPPIRNALGSEIEIRQGVSWRAPASPHVRQIPTETFADTVRLFGFDMVELLFEAARNATRLLQEASPHLIVADCAPTMRLASLGKIPTVVVGSGYTVPPAGQLLPLMRPWGEKVEPKSRAHEALLLAAANEVSARLSGPAIDYFADLFQGEESFVCTLAEFDPYRNSRTTTPLWPFNIPKMPPPRPFVECRRAAIFCYLQKVHPGLSTVLAALNGLDCKSEVYVAGVDPRSLAQRSSPQIQVHHSPVDYAAVLPEVSLVIHRGGLGTTHAGLAAGVPQIVLPTNLEQIITAKGLEQFATGVAVGAAPEAKLQELIRRMLTDPRWRETALRVAGELERRRNDDSLDRIVTACMTHL
jgi:rhamnosyltransferase subunit B